MAKNLILWVVIAIVLMSVFNSFGPPQISTKQLAYSDFIEQVRQGQVSEVMIEGRTIQGKRAGGEEFLTYSPGDTGKVAELLDKGVVIKARPQQQQSLLKQLFISWFPMLLVIAVWIFFMRQMQGGGGGRGAMSFGRSRARMMGEDQVKVTFADVAGVEEAKEEVAELVEFLRDPSKFQKLGGKIPRGVLMVGSPGTGKTLLAKAIAGEAKVPFFSISGSDFVEMFVGVGAARVRDMFEQAKKHAPCIIFIDEIDAVGRHRGAGLGGGHDEREQTLNQMLDEMDGFDVNRGVILIAATNRPDILAPALLRPGRFDRQIVVDRPDLVGRKAILAVHSKGKPFAPDVDLGVIARRTPGFTGADLANVINAAALLTARTDAMQITTGMLEESIDRVIAGPMRKTRVMSEKEKKVTAYHEGGHALVAWALPNTDPVHKISIIARGRSLGHTLVLPEEDKYSQTRSEMMDMLAYALGGRAAEELVFHEPPTGASHDIEKATATARAMVMPYGKREKLGPMHFGRTEGDVFLGRDLGHERDFSEEVASQIDEAVRELIERGHDEAWEILVQYRDVLDDMVLKLLDKEPLSKADLMEIFASVDKRPARQIVTARKAPKGRPPVLTPAALATLGPKAVADLPHGNGSRSRTNGTRNGSRSTASSRSRANRTAKSDESGTPRKRTSRRQAPGTTA